MRILLIAVLLFGCGNSSNSESTEDESNTGSQDDSVGSEDPQPEPEPEPDSTRPAPEAPAEMRACSEDAECVVVQMTCCDHCNSGIVWAVAQEHQAAAEAQKVACQEGEACTALACADAVSACAEGACTITRSGLQPD